MNWLFDRLPKRVREARARRVRVRPTRDGMWFLALLLGVLAAAVNTGNNLLYVVLACLLSLLIVANVLAEINLRGIEVRRELPPEAFAGAPSAGWMILRNTRPRGRAWTVHVQDLAATNFEQQDDAAVLAEGVGLVVPPGEELRVPVRWRFPHRGPTILGVVRLTSGFPFGILRRSRAVLRTEHLVVYPRPIEGGDVERGAGRGARIDSLRRRGVQGDLMGFREYVPGDSLRHIHWVTSARAGKPMVLLRAGQVAREVVIRVDSSTGEQLERAVQRATGAVLQHLSHGHAVGLELGDEVLEPRAGPGWRRKLLGRLATFGLEFSR
jgi:uncharacterized protein (DUF58 family)